MLALKHVSTQMLHNCCRLLTEYFAGPTIHGYNHNIAVDYKDWDRKTVNITLQRHSFLKKDIVTTT